jgi:hypothetical protein
MDFFYRPKHWYAGQFVRKIIPRIKLTKKSIFYFTTLLNKQKHNLLSVLVRDVDKTFINTIVDLPTNNGQIDFDFIDSFITEIEAIDNRKLQNYLSATGLKDFTLTSEEKQVLIDFKEEKIEWDEFTYNSIFNKITQGKRLKKDDQIAGRIPFVMAGVTNAGVADYISNPVASFPKNSITIDIFGNTFYRNYAFGAGDDTGVYWNTEKNYSKETMLFFSTSMQKSISGKFDFGNKLRSSQSLKFTMKLPTQNQQPNFKIMGSLVSAIQKLVIKDIVLYAIGNTNETLEIT